MTEEVAGGRNSPNSSLLISQLNRSQVFIDKTMITRAVDYVKTVSHLGTDIKTTGWVRLIRTRLIRSCDFIRSFEKS